MNSDARRLISDHFTRFHETDFSEWLSQGFKAFYSKIPLSRQTVSVHLETRPETVVYEGASTQPFDFAYTLIGKTDSLIEDIESIYNNYIPNEKKILFRLSIGRLFRQCVTDDFFPEPAVPDLIYLMANVKAYEALESLAPIIGRGKYGQDRQWLQYEAITVLTALLPAKEALDGLRNLITLPNFCVGYSFDVLTSLCRYDPMNWANTFFLLCGHIAELYNQAESVGTEAIAEFEEEVRQFARAFSRFTPTNEVAEQLPRIVLTNSPAELYRSGTWLAKQLFAWEKPLFFLDHSNGVFSTDSRFVQIPVAVSEQNSRTSIIKWRSEQYMVLCSILIYSDVTSRLNTKMSFGEGVVRKLSSIFPVVDSLLPLRSVA